MKISLYDSFSKLSYNPNTERNAGVGGTQTIIVNVARELAKLGHEVTVFNRCNFPDIYDGVKYYQYYDYKLLDEDLLIGFEGLPKNYNVELHGNRKAFNWSTRVNPSEVIKYQDVDKLIVLSDWHRDRYASELPSNLVKKMVVIEPGVSKEFFKNTLKRNHSIAYVGHPHKAGMGALIETAKRLKPKVPEAEIHVHGSGHLWGWDDKQYRKLYDDLIRNKILYHGGRSSGKKRMVKILGSSQIFLYPVGSHIQETFCLSILEAMASGCAIIASDNGNIKHLVGETGYLISGNIADYKWHLESVGIITKLFQNPSKMEQLGKLARERASVYTWEKTAKKIENLL